MPQLPENIRPAVALVAKHHFWLLAILAPLVLLPLLYMARGDLQREITSAQGTIRSRFDAMQGVRGVIPHPNEGWSTEINAETARIRGETLAEWQKFWASQQFLRVWPQELGPDFLQAAAALKVDAKLDRNMLARYQNTIPEVVRKLPARMGADEAMVDDRAAAGGRDRPSQGLVTWSAENQRKLRESFTWKRLPTNPQAATTQVVLAQEELWVYGLLCDAIKRANKDAAGLHNAAIIRVDQLDVGYPAAEPQPGGVGGNRIVLPKDGAAPAGDPGMPPPVPGAADGRTTKPSHPRFGGGGGPSPGGETLPGAAGMPAAAPDASLREWIYVDFDGRPLSAAELATAPAARMVHLMPFVLRITIDQRRLDALLIDLARQPVPIDVREVRINAGHEQAGAAGVAAADKKMERAHDVNVELRGSVGLAVPPNPAAIGIEPQAPPATDSAAAAPGPHGRRATRVARARETAA